MAYGGEDGLWRRGRGDDIILGSIILGSDVGASMGC